jgi:hypothetical protein
VLLAQALGLQTADGLLPWAALQAYALQLPAAVDEGWAWLTPCHWQVNADHVRMAAPTDTRISADESGAVMDTLRAFLAEDGIALHGLQPDGNWLARGRVFRDLPTASLERAAGGAVDHWLPRQLQAQPLRKLQNELQMLLYAHPLNDARAARGLLPVNSFWVSGTGKLPDGFSTAPFEGCVLLDDLREPSLQADTSAWVQAWRALDAGPLKALLEQARRGEPTELTLCGDTAAQTFTLQPQGRWSRMSTRISNLFSATDLPALLQSL